MVSNREQDRNGSDQPISALRFRRKIRDLDPVASLPLRCMLRRYPKLTSPAQRAKMYGWIKQDAERLAHRAGAVVAPSTISKGYSRDLTDPAYGSLHVTGEG